MTAVIGPLAISAFFLDPVIYSGVTKRSSLTNMRPWRLRVNSEREVCRSLDMKASTIKVEVHGFSLDHHCVQVCFLTRLIAPAVLSPAHLALSRACLASRYRHCHLVLQRNVRSANPTNWSLTLCAGAGNRNSSTRVLTRTASKCWSMPLARNQKIRRRGAKQVRHNIHIVTQHNHMDIHAHTLSLVSRESRNKPHHARIELWTLDSSTLGTPEECNNSGRKRQQARAGRTGGGEGRQVPQHLA